MNRRLNTVLFLCGATVFNVLLLFLYFLSFHGLVALFLPDRRGLVAVLIWLGLFLAALVSAWFTYRWAFRILRERIPLDRYFDSQLFKGLF